MAPMKIFLSHAHDDKLLARAIHDLMSELFESSIEIQYSSDGIDVGTPWLEWIRKTIAKCDLTLVMLTPSSVGKPWLLWESGAAAGVGLGTGETASVAPILFRLDMDAIPGPLQSQTAASGEERASVKKLLSQINAKLEKYGAGNFDTLFDRAFATYEAVIKDALARQPLMLTEAVVQEWLDRIAGLTSQARFAEVAHVHWALRLAKGQPGGDEQLDVRIHRRLGEAYLNAKHPVEAIAQFRLALKSSPRDIFLLHQLALAEAENDNLGEAMRIVDEEIRPLDRELETKNPEIAGLIGRLHRTRWEIKNDREDLRKARNSYAAALVQSPRSYYMADNVGQLSLALGEIDVARSAFAKSIQAIRKLGETSVWSLASLAGAYFAHKENDKGLAALLQLRAKGPSPREVDSIVQGLERIAEGIGASDADRAGWRKALKGPDLA